jgi:DNA-binding winged helix-turn-helix (wHTH) protein
MADLDPSAFRIGDWIFSPAANELHRGEARRKLEHRAARTLELLCRRRGSVVSQEEIVREIWNGRSVSANSVPVVISDLRQALGDDAREPRHIETVAKRGYRMLGEVEAEAPPPPAGTIVPAAGAYAWRWLGVAAMALAIAFFALWLATADRGRPVVVADVVNATGSPRWDPLASATSEVILSNVQALEGIEAVRASDGTPPPADSVRLGARLIMWSGRPTVMMSALDSKGVVVWTGMTSGNEDLIPREVKAAVATLPAKLGQGKE